MYFLLANVADIFETSALPKIVKRGSLAELNVVAMVFHVGIISRRKLTFAN